MRRVRACGPAVLTGIMRNAPRVRCERGRDEARSRSLSARGAAEPMATPAKDLSMPAEGLSMPVEG
eukprot:7383785-Prymnesium_polylepis.1